MLYHVTDMKKKIKVINNNCPYIIDKALFKFTDGDSVKNWAEVTYPDIANYLHMMR